MSNVWDRAAGAAVCHTLGTLGDGLVTAGAWTISTGVGVVPGLKKIGLGSLSYLAQGALCEPQEITPPSDPLQVDGCYKISGGYGWLQIREDTNQEFTDISDSNYPNADRATEIVNVEMVPSGGTFFRVNCTYKTSDGETRVGYTEKNGSGAAARVTYRIRPTTGSCGSSTDGGPTAMPDGYDEPYEWTDELTNCVFEIILQGFMRPTENDNALPVYTVQSKDLERANGGGRIGGCDFSPHLVVGGPSGPGQPPVQPIPVPNPLPPDSPDGEPWWTPVIRGVIQGTTTAVVTRIFNEWFGTKYPVGTREIYAACDYKENGDPETFSVTFPEEKYQDRVLTALNAIVDFQQQILLWKTPTCSTSNKPDLFLHWRSITFESDDYTDTGNSRLVKRLRYRGSSPGDVVQLAEHWRDFEWDTGGVIVYHKGSPVGTPQVWASSVDEGQRVLRHAFGEAGVDPDQVGEWGVSSSDHPRYGVSRRVKLKVVDGCWMATARTGPSGWPEAAICSPSP